MIKIYIRSGCPFCALVLQKANQLNIKIETLDISNPENLQSLLEKGGKQTVPFLDDEEKGISMYESGDIANYLEENYKK